MIAKIKNLKDMFRFKVVLFCLVLVFVSNSCEEHNEKLTNNNSELNNETEAYNINDQDRININREMLDSIVLSTIDSTLEVFTKEQSLKEKVHAKEVRNESVNSLEANTFRDNSTKINYSGYGKISVSKIDTGHYLIKTKKGSYLNSISIIGNKESLPRESNELKITVDNSSMLYNRTFMIQTYDLNNGSLFDGIQYGLIPNQVSENRVTIVTIPGLSGFSEEGFQIEMR